MPSFAKLNRVLSLIGVGAALLIAAARAGDAPAVIAAPAATYRVRLPLIARSEPPPARIRAITAPATSVPRYGKFEVAFQIDTFAKNLYFPYDPTAPINEAGVSVDMLLTAPDGSARSTPCFFYQPVDANLTPIGSPDWRCRFAPDAIGTWQYRLRLIDQSGTEESAVASFEAVASSSHGYIRVSPTDPRYFEFDDGTPFLAPLVNVEWGNPLNSLDLIRSNIAKWGQNGVRFVRWFPTGESGNYYVVPFGDDIRSSWGFGPTWTVPESDPATADKFSLVPYYYTGQLIRTQPGARYRLSLRVKVEGGKVFRPQIGNVVTEIRATDWRDVTLETTATGSTLMAYLRDGFSENDNTSGAIYVHDVRVQRDETGSGGWGPNLITRGDADTYNFVDQVGAARLDEVLRLSEQDGVYHKLTLFHKNDAILDSLAPDGSVVDWDPNRFYSTPGQAVNRYQKAYARYFVARWGYSTALHSIELANENNFDAAALNTAFDILGYVRSLQPRPLLLTNSFWGWFVTEFWLDPTRGSLIDYADKHWYARPGTGDPELVSTLYTDSAGNVRQCQRRFDEYHTDFNYAKPIVRGETGVWSADWNPMDFGSGAATYYHKQLWANMGDNCGGEWYTDYLTNNNLWGDYLRYEQFLQNEPLTNGTYSDIGSDTGSIGVASSAGLLRAWGKFSAAAGRGVIWIDNANDTWQRVANGQAVTAASGTVTINNAPNGTYQVTWFNTATGATTTNTQSVTNGKLALAVSGLAHDVAVKFRKQ